MSNTSKDTASQGVTLDNLAALSPDPKGTPSDPAEGTDSPKNGRISIAAADPDVLAEIRGLSLFLARTRGRDGLRTVGHLFDAALMGKGSLPVWREKYNEGNLFDLVRDNRVPEDDPRQARLSISGVDLTILRETKGLVMHLATIGSRDGLRTIGDVFNAAFKGEGNLPSWRKKYNKGRKFPPADALPPGRK